MSLAETDNTQYNPFTNTPSIGALSIPSGSISTPNVATSSTDTDSPSPASGPASGPTSSPSPANSPANSPASGPAASDSIGPASGSPNFSDLVKAVFNVTTMTILFWVLTAYIIFKLGSAIFSPKPLNAVSSGQLAYSRTIDVTLSIVFMIALFGSYYNLPNNEQNNITGYTLEWMYQFFNDPWSLLLLVWFTIVFFFLVFILRVPTAPDVKPVLVSLVETNVWVFYALFGIIFFFKYVLNIQIVNILLNNSFVRYLENLPPASSGPSVWNMTPSPSFAPSPSLAPSPSPSPSPAQNKQVFNISQNKYTFKQAQDVCTAFDASLATYDQIESAYNAGAEWCNYGWSAGQMAYFPTQKTTYDRLAQNPNTKNACGRPGINGGFMGNPNIRFGVNCYGVKPTEPANWTPPVIGAGAVTAPEPYTIPEDPQMGKLRKNAKIAGFNNAEWSRY